MIRNRLLVTILYSFIFIANSGQAKPQLNLSNLNSDFESVDSSLFIIENNESETVVSYQGNDDWELTGVYKNFEKKLTLVSYTGDNKKHKVNLLIAPETQISAENFHVLSSGKVTIDHNSTINSFSNIIIESDSISVGSADINAHADIELRSQKEIELKGKFLGIGKPNQPSLYAGNIITLSSEWIKIHKSFIRANIALFLNGARTELRRGALIKAIRLYSNLTQGFSQFAQGEIQVGTAVFKAGSVSLDGRLSQGNMQGGVLDDYTQNPKLKEFIEHLSDKKIQARKRSKFRSFSNFNGLYFDAVHIRIKANNISASGNIFYKCAGSNSVFEHMPNASTKTTKSSSDIILEAEKVRIDGILNSRGSILGNSHRIKSIETAKNAVVSADKKIELESYDSLSLAGSLKTHDLILKSNATRVKAKVLTNKIHSISRSFRALQGPDISTNEFKIEGAYEALLSGNVKVLKNSVISAWSSILKGKIESQSLGIQGNSLNTSKDSDLQVNSLSTNLQGLAQLQGCISGQSLGILANDLEILESAKLDAEDLISLIARMDLTIAGKLNSKHLHSKAGNTLTFSETGNCNADLVKLEARLLELKNQSKVQAKQLGLNSRLTHLEAGSQLEAKESLELSTQELFNAGHLKTKQLNIESLALTSANTSVINAESAHIYSFLNLGLDGSTKIDRLNLVSQGDIELSAEISSDYLSLIGTNLNYRKSLNLNVNELLYSKSHWDTHIDGLIKSRGTLYVQAGNKLSIGKTTVSAVKDSILTANTIDTSGILQIHNASIVADKMISFKSGSVTQASGKINSIKTQDLMVENGAQLKVGDEPYSSFGQISADHASIAGSLLSLGQLAATIKQTEILRTGDFSGENVSFTGESLESEGRVSINNYFSKLNNSIFTSKPEFELARFQGNTLIANNGIDAKQAELALNEVTLNGVSKIDTAEFKNEILNLVGTLRSKNAYLDTIGLIIEEGASLDSQSTSIKATSALVKGNIASRQLIMQGTAAELGSKAIIDADILRLTFAKMASEAKISADDAVICAFSLALQGVNHFDRLQINSSDLEIGEFLNANRSEINTKMLNIMGSAVLRNSIISANQLKNNGNIEGDNISVYTNIFDNYGKFDSSNLEIIGKTFKNSGKIAGSNLVVLAEQDFLSPGELDADQISIELPKSYNGVDFGKIKAGSYVLFKGELDSDGVMSLLEKGQDTLNTGNLRIITTEPFILSHSVKRVGELQLQAADITLQDGTTLSTGSMALAAQGKLQLNEGSRLEATSGEIAASAGHIFQGKGSHIKALGNVSLHALGNIIQEGERDPKTGEIKTASIESGKDISVQAEGIIQSIAGSFKAKGSLLIHGKEGLYIVPIIWTEEHRSSRENLFFKQENYEYHEYQQQAALEGNQIHLKTEGDSEILNLALKGQLKLEGGELSKHEMVHIKESFRQLTTFGQVAVSATKALINGLAVTPVGFAVAFAGNMAVDGLLAQELGQSFDPQQAAISNMTALAFKAAGDHFFDAPGEKPKLFSKEMFKATSKKMAFNLSRSVVLAAVQGRNLNEQDLLRASLTTIIDSGFSYLELKLGQDIGIDRDIDAFLSNAGSDVAIQALFDGKIDLEAAGLAGLGAVIDQRAGELGQQLGNQIADLEKYFTESQETDLREPTVQSMEDLDEAIESRATLDAIEEDEPYVPEEPEGPYRLIREQEGDALEQEGQAHIFLAAFEQQEETPPADSDLLDNDSLDEQTLADSSHTEAVSRTQAKAGDKAANPPEKNEQSPVATNSSEPIEESNSPDSLELQESPTVFNYEAQDRDFEERVQNDLQASEPSMFDHLCFIGGTLVATPEGFVPIEEIELGDKVLSCDEEDNSCNYMPVVKVYEPNLSWVLRELTLGQKGQETEAGMLITSTVGHPFYTEQQKSPIEARKIRVGMRLRTKQASLPVLNAEFKLLDTPVHVYNIEVERNHNYFIKQGSACRFNLTVNDHNEAVLTHNCDDGYSKGKEIAGSYAHNGKALKQVASDPKQAAINLYDHVEDKALDVIDQVTELKNNPEKAKEFLETAKKRFNKLGDDAVTVFSDPKYIARFFGSVAVDIGHEYIAGKINKAINTAVTKRVKPKFKKSKKVEIPDGEYKNSLRNANPEAKHRALHEKYKEELRKKADGHEFVDSNAGANHFVPNRKADLPKIFSDLDKHTLVPISQRQKGMIQDKLSTIKQRDPKVAKVVRRDGFGYKEEKALIKKWELETGNKWPTTKGTRATPHHIIPLKNGGANEWWNLAPVKHPHNNNLHNKGTALRNELPYNRSQLPPGTITEL